MSADSQVHKEIRRLLWAMRDGVIAPDDAEHLRTMLLEDPKAREFYVWHMFLAGSLEWDHSAGASGQWSVAGGQCKEGSGIWDQGSGASIHPSSLIPHPSSIPPIIVDPSPTLHSPLGSFLFSHLAAAVILGIGLLIGLAWRISLPTPERQEPSVAGVARPVGRITVLADCKWSKQGSGFRGQVAGIPKTKDQRPKTVYLGDRFLLSSGLMEITYDTGAKVILQGPCTYEIDSDRGGYLAIGKLTARVEKGSGGRDQGSGKTHSSAFSLQPSALFAVRTPTATVTDLGTEFGVEVEQSGATRSHVFQGSVEVRSSNSRRLTTSEESVEILRVGESARVERGRNQKAIITREPGQSNRFIRRIPSSFIPHPSSLGKSPSSLIPHPSSLAYRLTDLGTFGGGMSKAHAINAAGQVVGEATTASGVTHAFLHANGKLKDLGTIGGGNSCAYGVNSTGHIVGKSGTGDDDCRAFVFSNGKMTDLGTLGGPAACAMAINDVGQIVGHSQKSDSIRHAFLYTRGTGLKDIGALGGPKAQSGALGINATGFVVGRSETKAGLVHAFLYGDSVMKDLGTLGGNDSLSHRINALGQVVGVSTIADGNNHAFVYENNMGMRDLGAFSSGNSFAADINNQGQIVGTANRISNGAACIHAFLFSSERMIDMNDLVDPAIGWTLVGATAINDSGQIVGQGKTPDGNTRAFLLTPVNRPRGEER